jgi:DNA polymerase III delta prime subunit
VSVGNCPEDAVADARVNLTQDGREALLKLSRGDMRRALNVLQVSSCGVQTACRSHQACHAAYDSVDETAVYNCTGNPHPKDIERVVQSMMSDEFGTSFDRAFLISSRVFRFVSCIANSSDHLAEDGERSGFAGSHRWSVRFPADGRIAKAKSNIPP